MEGSNKQHGVVCIEHHLSRTNVHLAMKAYNVHKYLKLFGDVQATAL